MSADRVFKNKKYQLVTPDGGWGYMICLAFIIIISNLTMLLGCFGMLYNDFMKEIGVNSTLASVLLGINAFSFSICGFFTNSLLKLLSTRKLAMIGAIVNAVATLGLVFANDVFTFFVFQGLMPGLSTGLMYNLVCTIMNDYFDKKRLFAFSFVQFFVALLTMIVPMFVRWSLDFYGFRGTLLLLSGISMQNIFAVLIMHPVDWHMKRVEVPVESEMKTLLVDEKTKSYPVIKLTDAEAVAEKSEHNITAILPEECGKTSVIMKIINNIIDVSFLKKYVIRCACIGPAICNYAEVAFSILLPQALYTMGWNQNMVALAISIYSLGDMVMRVILIFASNWLLKIGVQELYISGIAIGFLARLCMLWSENPIPIYVYIALIGVSKCFTCVLVTVVISDTVSPDKFTEAMGINMLESGLTILILGPIIGAIRDLTNSYPTAFYLLASLMAIVILFWSIELCYKKNRLKAKRGAVTLKTNK